tara:strand:- start:1728 stop:2459 length:732 start_codon:yes stop_codon:yes gene_type:complete
MSDENNINIEEALKDLFSEVEDNSAFEVTIPSLGKGYTNTNKVVSIRAMNFDDEKFIAGHSGKTILDDLIKRCVSDVDLEELYLEDKLFLYYKIREYSFGSVTKLISKCEACGQENDLEIDLSQLNIDYASDDFENPRTIKLPTLQKDVVVCKLQAHNQDYAKTPEQLLDNLWRFIKKIGEYTDPILISKVVKKLSSADLRSITGSINQVDFGLDTRARYVCNSCRTENTALVGLSSDFFTLS